MALLNSGATIQQIDNFIDTLNKFNEIEEFGIKTIINTKIKSTIEYVDKRIKYNNSIEGYFNGKNLNQNQHHNAMLNKKLQKYGQAIKCFLFRKSLKWCSIVAILQKLLKRLSAG